MFNQERRARRRRILARTAVRRAAWMRAGAVSALAAVVMLVYSARLGYTGEAAGRLRWAGQLHLVHAMAAFACATFMNIGASTARHAAPAFVLGGWLLAGPAYLSAFGLGAPELHVQAIGLGLVCAGWLILAWSAGGIDVEPAG